jgi:hypothetical protein
MAPVALSLLPTRTTIWGFDAASAMAVVVLKMGLDIIPCGGEMVRSSWRKPPMSPRALRRCGPTGGLMRSSTAVCSMPRAATDQRTIGCALLGLAESMAVMLSVPQTVAPVT